MMLKKIKCNLCGNTFLPGNQPNGMPNGVGLVKNGITVNVCYQCVLDIGKGNEVLRKKLLDKCL